MASIRKTHSVDRNVTSGEYPAIQVCEYLPNASNKELSTVILNFGNGYIAQLTVGELKGIIQLAKQCLNEKGHDL